MAALIDELAYAVVQGADLDAWSRFGERLLGFEVKREGSVLTMRMDSRPFRYLVLENPGSSLPTLGWRVANAAILAVLDARLKDLAISTSPLAPPELRIRQAAGGLRFVCHNGIAHEVAYGLGDGAAYHPPGDVTRFVTGTGGLGHTAWLIPHIAPMDELM